MPPTRPLPSERENRSLLERLSTLRVVPERDAPEIREVIVSPYRVVYRLGREVVEISRSFAVRGSFRNPFHSVGPTATGADGAFA